VSQAAFAPAVARARSFRRFLSCAVSNEIFLGSTNTQRQMPWSSLQMTAAGAWPQKERWKKLVLTYTRSQNSQGETETGCERTMKAGCTRPSSTGQAQQAAGMKGRPRTQDDVAWPLHLHGLGSTSGRGVGAHFCFLIASPVFSFISRPSGPGCTVMSFTEPDQ